MIKRKVVFRKKRQNRLGMFLVTIVVLMLLVVVSINSVGLRQKKESYLERAGAAGTDRRGGRTLGTD